MSVKNILVAGMFVVLVATPALAQAPSPEAQLAAAQMMQAEALQDEQKAWTAAATFKAEVDRLKAENDKLKAAAPKPEKKP